MATSLPLVPANLQQYIRASALPQKAPEIKVDPNAAPLDRLMQGLDQGGVVVSTMDGRKGFVHGSAADEFLKNNPDWKRSVVMTAPDGNPVAVRPEVAADVLKQGYTVGTPLPKNMTAEGNPLLDTVEGPGGFRIPNFEQPTAAEKFFPPLGVFKHLRNIRKAASVVAANARAEGEAPDAAPIVKNVVGPTGEAAAGFLGSQFEPSTLGTLGIMRYLPTNTATLRTLGRAAGAYLTAKAGQQAVEEGGQAVEAAKSGDIPGAVRAGTSAAFSSGMAAEGAYRAGQSAPAGFRDLPEASREIARSRPVQALAKSAPVKLATSGIKSVTNRLVPQTATAGELATEAWRPRNAKVNWKEESALAMPDIKRAAEQSGIDANNMTLRDSEASAIQAQRDVWKEYTDNYLDPRKARLVSTQPVADAMRATVTDLMKEQQSGLAKSIEQKAATLDDRELPLQEVQNRLQQLNNQTRAIEARYLVDKKAAKLSANNAWKFAQRDAYRRLIDDAMDSDGPQAALLRKRYGALNSVLDTITRRIPVAERGSKMPLHRTLALVGGVGQIVGGGLTLNPALVGTGLATIGTEAYTRKVSSPDYLNALAMRKTKASAPARVPQRTSPSIRGLLKAPAIPLAAAPEPEYIPPAPPSYSDTTRASRLGLLLPAPATPLGPAQFEEGPTSRKAAKRTTRNRKTGKMTRQYLTSAE